MVEAAELRNPDRYVFELTRALMNDEYMMVGAVIKLKSHTGYTVPWFLIVKDDGLGGQKVRFILKLKKVNAFLHAPKFTLESTSKIYCHLRKGMWAASIDLKHAYLHLGLLHIYHRPCQGFVHCVWGAIIIAL